MEAVRSRTTGRIQSGGGEQERRLGRKAASTAQFTAVARKTNSKEAEEAWRRHRKIEAIELLVFEIRAKCIKRMKLEQLGSSAERMCASAVCMAGRWWVDVDSI